MFKPKCFDFTGKSVIVTGASRGIGKAISTALHSAGATVYAISRNPTNLKALEAELPGVKTVVCDVSDWASTQKLLQNLPVVDFLVNNAAIMVVKELLEHEETDMIQLYQTNLASVTNISQVFAKKLIDAKRPGSIINISSNAGQRPVAGIGGYSVFKAALDNLTKVLALELGPHNIRVNSINPASVNTDMLNQVIENMSRKDNFEEQVKKFQDQIPMPQKSVSTAEIANLALFMLSDAVPMMHGALVPVTGGFML